MTNLFLHHYYVPKEDFGYTFITDFHEQFDNADHIGTDAILETYNRLFEECKSNETFLRELMIVLNHRVAFWGGRHRKEMNKQHLEFGLLYLDLYEKIYKYRRGKNYYSARKNWQILE